MLSTSVFFLNHLKTFVMFLVQTSTRLIYPDEGLWFLVMFLYSDGRSFSSRDLLLPKAKFVEGIILSYGCAKRWGSWSFCLSVYYTTCWRIELHHGALSLSLSVSLCPCVCVSLSQLCWNVLKWNHGCLMFYLFILQCWSSYAIFRKLEIWEFIGQFEDIPEEFGSMLVVSIRFVVGCRHLYRGCVLFTIWAPSC